MTAEVLRHWTFRGATLNLPPALWSTVPGCWAPKKMGQAGYRRLPEFDIGLRSTAAQAHFVASRLALASVGAKKFYPSQLCSSLNLYSNASGIKSVTPHHLPLLAGV